MREALALNSHEKDACLILQLHIKKVITKKKIS